MAVRKQSRETRTHGEDSRPAVTCCESRPGKQVFVEAGNTDGWIATNLTVEPVR